MVKNPNPIGSQIIRLDSVASTNDYAHQLALQGMAEGCVVIARQQIAGKGRFNRKWDSQNDLGLWFSIIFRPPISARHATIFPFFTSVALVHSLKTHLDLTVQLKWPNDLLINKKKIGGILSEVEFNRRFVKFVIIGIGINLFHSPNDFPAELQQKAGSLSMFSKAPLATGSLFETILADLNHYYKIVNRDGFETIIREWKTNCPYFKQTIQLRQSTRKIQGSFHDLAPDGSLILQQGNELLKISAGDIEF